MKRRPFSWPMYGLLAVLTTAIAGQEKIAPPKEKERAAKDSAAKTTAAKTADDAHQADPETIRQQAREFAQAFAKGDAKALAAAWTEQGEYHDDAGTSLFGRAEIEKEFAQKAYESALTALELARSDAARQHRYLATIANPIKPDEATYPRRIMGVFTVFVLSFLLMGIGTLVAAAVREHSRL